MKADKLIGKGRTPQVAMDTLTKEIQEFISDDDCVVSISHSLLMLGEDDFFASAIICWKHKDE